MECDQCFPSEPFVVLIVGQFVGRGILFLSFKRATSHVFRKTGTLPLICRRNRSHHYINDRV